MTVIRPNSVSGINSITANGGDINLFRADGTKADIPIVNNITAGVVTATSFSGSGANLTSIPAGNLTGTVADARISALTASKLTGALPAISGANLTGINTAFGSGTSINTSGIITATAFVPTAQGSLSHRNVIINGDHRIAQRGTAAVTATTSASYKCVDRWKTDIDGSSGGDFSHAQSTDVPAGQGFTHSSKITTVTQASQPSGTSNRHQLYTMLEKYDVAHLEWGTSAAKTCTLSFWVKSSVTGTYILWLKHYGGTSQHYYTNYTINSANTWEKKTITLTGYTSGGNVTGTLNEQGLLIEWNLGVSSGYETGTLNEWTTSGDIRAASGSVYLPENAGATWYLTGCQFEVGSVATPFEHRSFGEELTRCYRYFQKDLSRRRHWASGNTSNRRFPVVYPVEMRDTPSVSFTSTSIDSGSFTANGITRQGYYTNMSGSGRFYEWSHELNAEL